MIGQRYLEEYIEFTEKWLKDNNISSLDEYSKEMCITFSAKPKQEAQKCISDIIECLKTVIKDISDPEVKGLSKEDLEYVVNNCKEEIVKLTIIRAKYSNLFGVNKQWFDAHKKTE